MRDLQKPIAAECEWFVCRECHTKTGHPHQKWCPLPAKGKEGCGDCIYWQRGRQACGHPYRKKGGVGAH
ncbi:MAG: hypothetical protein IJU50_06455 [Lachnospiraceae bacterium]|nr:hypothetical protein [Lachnospiraceae bacterium]